MLNGDFPYDPAAIAFFQLCDATKARPGCHVFVRLPVLESTPLTTTEHEPDGNQRSEKHHEREPDLGRKPTEVVANGVR